MNKPFRTISEQIKLLKERKLNIDNSERLQWYLKSFNYQNLINGYNDPFFSNHDRKNSYDLNSYDFMILDLFNFNRTISSYILNDLHTIEMKFSTAISYIILKNVNKVNKNATCFDDLDLDTISLLFRIYDHKLLKNLETNFNECKNKQFIKAKKYQNFQQTPIYTLSLI